MRGEYLHRGKLELAWRDVMLAIKQIIEGSKLAQAEKLEILQNLSQIAIATEQIKRDQARAVEVAETAEGNSHRD
jgi:hypothetical protein